MEIKTAFFLWPVPLAPAAVMAADAARKKTKTGKTEDNRKKKEKGKKKFIETKIMLVAD